MAKQDIPLSLNIPTPVPFERARAKGIESSTGPNGCLVQYRGTTFEKERIKRAAEYCGVSYGTFMRSVVTDAAAVIIAVCENKDKSA